MFSRLALLRTPETIPVRQASGLPRASFRFRLAADTLASGCVLGATSCTQDFHPLERARAERTSSRRRSFAPPSSHTTARTGLVGPAVSRVLRRFSMSLLLPFHRFGYKTEPDPVVGFQKIILQRGRKDLRLCYSPASFAGIGPHHCCAMFASQSSQCPVPCAHSLPSSPQELADPSPDPFVHPPCPALKVRPPEVSGPACKLRPE